MLSRPSIYVLAVLAIFVAVAQCEDKTIGKRQKGDSLVNSATVIKPAVVGKTVVRTHLYIPKNGRKAKITAIRLHDRKVHKDETHVKVIEGGLGKSYALLVFYSNPGYAIEYGVKIYAK